jgi:hypothetical protein
MVNIDALLAKGYLPRELPPPFSSLSFGGAAVQISRRWNQVYTRLGKQAQQQFRVSSCTKFSIPRVNYSRRILSLPNPLHQMQLAALISANWPQIDAICRRSRLASSRPVLDTSGARAVVTRKKFREYKHAYVQDSFDRLFEVRTDIARFFPSIYTHSLAWAIHGKATAKSNRSRSLWGNALDSAVQACQAGQTIGIPIGPDTSLVLSEIIGAAIDELILKKQKASGYRFVDDFHLFCRTQDEAEHLLRYLQACFAEYELDMNDSKTDIRRFPQPFEAQWTIALGSLRLDGTAKQQRRRLSQYFSSLYHYQLENPGESVVKYGLGIFQTLRLHIGNWRFLESLLLKTVIASPQCLPDLYLVLLRFRKAVQRRVLRRALLELLRTHSDKGHSFELSWVLWIAKFFDVKLPASVLRPIIASLDPAATIMTIDLYRSKLVSGYLDIRSVRLALTSASLKDSGWLLTYELLKKGWIRMKDNPVRSDHFFHLLLDFDVDFYDSSKRLMADILKATPPSPDPWRGIVVWGGDY